MLGIYIPAARHGTIGIRQFHGLEDMQSAVRGLIEPIELQEPSMTMIVNEEGLPNYLPVNRRATAVLWAHNEDYRFKHYVLGSALLIGPLDESGEFTDAPREIETLIRSRLFAIEYVRHQSGAPRVAEGIDDVWDAYATAIRLRKDYGGNFRVVAA